MSEVLSYAEIKDRFDGQWVLIGDPVTNENLEVLSGKLLCHSKDRDEVDRKALELRPKHSAIFYLGTIREGMEVVL